MKSPMIGDNDLAVAKLYGMLPVDDAAADGGTVASNATVRSVLMPGPDRTIKLMLTYPMSTGRNFDEILRVLDSMQLTAKHKVSTPVGSKPDDDIVLSGAVTKEGAETMFPGYKTIKPYLRTASQRPERDIRFRSARRLPRIRLPSQPHVRGRGFDEGAEYRRATLRFLAVPLPFLTSRPPGADLTRSIRVALAWVRSVPPTAALVVVIALSGCASLAPPVQGPPTHHFVDTAGTELGAMLQPQLAAHPDRSGVLPLRGGREALAARLELTALAQRSIDVQYYIWHDDASGRDMIEALTRAARRGVRVRVLLDDNATGGLDRVLARFDAPRNIEVRLFNPFVHRRFRLLSFLTDFDRLNRRMHNKSFTVDNQATIVGGRNIGDEYFDAGRVMDFIDLDVLAVGPVVDQVSSDFDRYWSSAWSYPLAQIVPVDRLRAKPVAPQTKADAAAAAALRDDGSIARGERSILDALCGHSPIEWTTVHLVSDDPAKIAGDAAAADTVVGQLRHALGEPTRELDIVSAYFVLEPADIDVVTGWAHRGVAISVLTNSLAATDVPAVHAGYAKSRKPLLQAGVRLFEMKPDAAPPPRSLHYGSSNASLHAKTFEVDRRRVFIGSYNVDPRSRDLNTEMGFVIDSPALAGELADLFVSEIPQRAYQVQLTPSGDLRWLDRQGDRTTMLDHEPQVSTLRLLLVKLLSLLPIDGLL